MDESSYFSSQRQIKGVQQDNIMAGKYSNKGAIVVVPGSDLSQEDNRN